MEPNHKHTIVTNILKEFAYIMLPELPKTLPPFKGMDYCIKLESGAKPIVKPLYHMTPLELVELRKQLNKLLNGGLIHSSKDR